MHRVEKPWGYELWWARTDRYVGKLIHINKGQALSLQYHNRKDETIYVHAGKMLFEMGPSADALVALRREPRDIQALAERGYRHERLDQLVTELLLGVR